MFLKTRKLLLGILIGVFLLVPKLSAKTLEAIKTEVEAKQYEYTVTGGSINWWFGDDVIAQIRQWVSDDSLWYENEKWDYKYYYLTLTRVNNDTLETEKIDVKVPLKLKGDVVFNDDDILSGNVGDTFTVGAKDKSGSTAKNLTIDRMYESGESNLVEITGNKIKLKKNGVAEVNVEFTNGDSRTIIVLIGAQSLINEGITNLSSFTSIRNGNTEGYDKISAAEYNLGQKLLSYNGYFGIVSNSELVSGNVYNINYKIKFRNYLLNVAKSNVTILEKGIILSDAYGVVDLNIGETYTPEFESFSDITWVSLNESVASVNNSGVVTAIEPGATIIKAIYDTNKYEFFKVRVRPNTEFINTLQDKVDDALGVEKKVEVPAVSTLVEWYLREMLDTIVEDLFDDENIRVNVNTNDLRTGTIKFGYTYTFDLDDEKTEEVDYCNYIESYSPGFDCNITANVTFVFPDKKEGFNSALVTKAKSLASKLKSFDKGAYPSYLDLNFDQYLDVDQTASKYLELLIKNAELDSLIQNNDGLKLVIDTRAGDDSFGEASVMGPATIQKDGVIYALGPDIEIQQVVRLNVQEGSPSDQIIEAIKTTIENAITYTPKPTVTVTKEGSDIYNIKVSYDTHLSSVTGTKVKTQALGRVLNIKTHVKLTSSKITASIKANNNALTVSWNSINGASSYSVLRSTSKTGKYSTIKSGLKTTRYTDKGLTYGKTYYYKVKSAGKTVKTSAVVSKKVVPNKVSSLTVSAVKTNSLLLTYSKVNAKGYIIERSTNGKKYSKIKTITSNKTVKFKNTGLKANTKYYYRVAAISGNVKGSYSPVVVVKTAPNVPIYKVALKDYNALTIKITAIKGASKYLIYRSTSKTGKYTKVGETTSDNLNYNDSSLKTGTTYYYKVKACNSNNNCSDLGKVVFKKVTPKTPILKVESTETGKVNVTVGKVNGATSYIVERSANKDKDYKVVKTISADGELTFEDPSKKGITYYYRVKSAVNKVYSGYSKYQQVKSK